MKTRVLHLTAELWPYARTGGLGQAVAGLADPDHTLALHCDVSDAAAVATAILPAERAVRLLEDALRTETNPVVRETLKDAIADRQEEQD